MARADLSSMLSRLDDEPTPPPAAQSKPAPQARPALAPTAAPARKATREPKRQQPATAAAETEPAAEPLYLRLERKETRLRADQYADLTAHARRLSRAKGTGGERITENTLIRIAIDLLLERAADLHGQTETELKNSVTL